MYKVLIADDEPLVQVGIKSMLNWGSLDMEICGIASNGEIALGMIDEHSPEIVVTDIKMPVMSGLELIKECRQKYGNAKPQFIILTSYEDFHMAKEALKYQVSDYLVKLELTPESLTEALVRAAEQIPDTESQSTESIRDVNYFRDKFFISLLHNLFESDEQFILQSNDLKLDFDYKGYICCYGEIIYRHEEALPFEKQLSLFSSSLQMINELAAKYIPSYCLTLDMLHFALIFCYEDKPDGNSFDDINTILKNIKESLQNYYNISMRCGIGSIADSPQAISISYQNARQAFHVCDDGENDNKENNEDIVFFESTSERSGQHFSFNIGLFKNDFTKAFEEYDSSVLKETIDSICNLFLEHPNYYVQALDAACNILYLAISLLKDGETIVDGFYKDEPDGYRSIYGQATVKQVVDWLNGFADKLCELFETHNKDYKNRIVSNVKKYINNHIRERLSLNEVAAVFGISPNYLSQLFSKHNETGFNEYVNKCKVMESKKLLDDGTMKVYEVADYLGFESSFYFSKVFKKVEGMSPTDYVNR